MCNCASLVYSRCGALYRRVKLPLQCAANPRCEIHKGQETKQARGNTSVCGAHAEEANKNKASCFQVVPQCVCQSGEESARIRIEFLPPPFFFYLSSLHFFFFTLLLSIFSLISPHPCLIIYLLPSFFPLNSSSFQIPFTQCTSVSHISSCLSPADRHNKGSCHLPLRPADQHPLRPPWAAVELARRRTHRGPHGYP